MNQTTFYYSGYDITWLCDGIQVKYRFSLDPNLNFEHSITISGVQLVTFDKQRLQTLVAHLGMVELLSYWKLVASHTIDASCVFLTPEQIAFWKNLYLKGMGEYFYKNKIDFTGADFLHIKARTSEETVLPSTQPVATKPIDKGILIPIGGGKDSAVTAEILRQHLPITTFIVNPIPAELAVAAQVSDQPGITVKREFDPKLFELNKQGYLNGHVPFSASLALVSVIAAELGGFTSVAVSNERSSNESNLTYLGQPINHQYSKSAEFESDLNTYLKPLTAVRYFSFVRPLYELQIAKLFATMPHFFSTFRSCNRGQKTNSWCGQCPKCLSIALTLLPWVGAENIKSIFTTNPLELPTNFSILLELAGRTDHKPFECVLTTEETLVSLHLCIEAYATKPLPNVLKQAKTNILNTENNLDERAQAILDSWETNSNMPDGFEEILKAAYHESI